MTIAKFTLLLPLCLLLCGCPAGIAPIAGYHVKDTTEVPRLLCSSDGPPKVALYESRVDHRYRLWVTPDGGRDAYPLKKTYHYTLLDPAGEKQALGFLSSPTYRRFKWIGALAEDRFVACALGEGEADPAVLNALGVLERPASLGYEVLVFDRKRILHRCELRTAYLEEGPGFSLEGGSLRFQGTDGPGIYDPKENKIKSAR